MEKTNTTLANQNKSHTQVLNLPFEVNAYQPKSSNNPSVSENSPLDLLNKMFPEQEHKNKTVKRTLEILGDLSDKLSVDEIQTMIVETEYLCETLLDDYEKKIFKGKTLKELLNEG